MDVHLNVVFQKKKITKNNNSLLSILIMIHIHDIELLHTVNMLVALKTSINSWRSVILAHIYMGGTQA